MTRVDESMSSTGGTCEEHLAAAREQIRNLEVALESNRTIGAAMGILMERDKLTPDQAFLVLRDCSSRRNVKLREIAEHVVETGELPPTPSKASTEH